MKHELRNLLAASLDVPPLYLKRAYGDPGVGSHRTCPWSVMLRPPHHPLPAPWIPNPSAASVGLYRRSSLGWFRAWGKLVGKL